MATNINKQRYAKRGKNDKKYYEKKSHDVTQKYTVFNTDGIIVNHWNISDSPVWSVHERRILLRVASRLI